MKLQHFEELGCWKQARELTSIIYGFTKVGRFEKDHRLKNQITGAAISIMNNIAEGFDSQSNAEFIRFLVYARRSVSEVRNCLYIVNDQSYINTVRVDNAFDQARTVSKLIDGLLRYLRSHRKR